MARRDTKRIQLTEKRIAAFEVPQKRTTVYDEEVRELGLRLERSGRRSFFWFRSVQTKLVFKTIGEYPAMSLVEARAKAQELNHQRAEWKGSDQTQPNPFVTQPKEDPITFKDLFERYISTQIRHYAHHPKEAERHVRWVYLKYLTEFNDRPITSITRKQVKEFHARMGEKFPPTSVDLSVKIIQRVYSWAIDQELFSATNPASQIKKFRVSERDRFLKADELDRLRNALKKEEDRDLRDFVEIALGSAARKTMITTADWKEFDWEREHAWTIPRHKMKGKRDKVKSFTPWLRPEARRAFEKRWKEAGEPSEGWVFPSHTRRGKYRSSFNREFKQLLAKAEITGVTIHDMRRTRLSFAAMAGVPLPAISAMAGHASLAPTMRYARLHSEAVEEASRKTDAEMERQMSEAAKPARLVVVK
jgi:integrase